MVRGYWIVRVDIRDPEAYKAYAAANGAAFAEFGGRFLVRAGAFESVSGSARARNVVIEFASYADALACWNSQTYQAARALQGDSAESDIVVIEGYDGAQPTASKPEQPANPASE